MYHLIELKQRKLLISRQTLREIKLFIEENWVGYIFERLPEFDLVIARDLILTTNESSVVVPRMLTVEMLERAGACKEAVDLVRGAGGSVDLNKDPVEKLREKSALIIAEDSIIRPALGGK